MDLHLSISNGFVSSKIYDTRDDFDFDIVNFPFLDGDVPCRPKSIYILKRKSFATLTKMLVLFFGQKHSLSDNAVDKSLYLPCIQHKNQNGVAYGCRAATIILRQPPILKSHAMLCEKSFFSQYLFSKAEWKTNSNQVNLCLCQCSLRLRDAFNF